MAWKSTLTEAERIADVHNRVRDRLMEEVYNTIKVWQKDNFHQKALTGIKEARDVDDAFRKVACCISV